MEVKAAGNPVAMGGQGVMPGIGPEGMIQFLYASEV